MKSLIAKALFLVNVAGLGAMAFTLTRPWLTHGPGSNSYLALGAATVEALDRAANGAGAPITDADLTRLACFAAPLLAVAWAAVAALTSLAGRDRAVGGFCAAGVAGLAAAVCFDYFRTHLGGHGFAIDDLSSGFHWFRIASIVLTAAGLLALCIRKAPVAVIACYWPAPGR